MRSLGMESERNVDSGLAGYPLSSSSRVASPVMNVAFVKGAGSPTLKTHQKTQVTAREMAV